MRGALGATRGRSERRNGRDGNCWSDCVLAGSTLAALAGCTNDIQPCPDVLDSSVDDPSGMFAPAEGRQMQRQVGPLLFTESFPRPAAGVAAHENALGSEGRPPYDSSAYPGPP